eukprot:SAG31_NODE_1613_length_7743_cov_5.584903_3_plen_134_part_00
MQYLRETMDRLAMANGERLLDTRNNSISLGAEPYQTCSAAASLHASILGVAMTLSTFPMTPAETSVLGSMLFSRCVSGTRSAFVSSFRTAVTVDCAHNQLCSVVTGVTKKVVAGISFNGYGAHFSVSLHMIGI